MFLISFYPEQCVRADFQTEALRNEEVCEATEFSRTSTGADVLPVVWPTFQTDLSRHRETSRLEAETAAHTGSFRFGPSAFGSRRSERK